MKSQSRVAYELNEIILLYQNKILRERLTHIGKLSGNDSEDFPETFSKKKCFAVLWRHYGQFEKKCHEKCLEKVSGNSSGSLHE